MAKGNAVGIARIDVVHRGYVATDNAGGEAGHPAERGDLASDGRCGQGLNDQAFKLTATYSDGSSRDVTASTVCGPASTLSGSMSRR